MNNWGEVHQNLFINIANALNNEEIQWTILRNYSGLPQNNSSKDVDISISYYEKEKVIKIIETVLWNSNFKFKKLIKFSFCYSFVYFNIEDNNIESLKIDLFWGVQLKGYLMASSEEIYSNSIDFGLFKGANNSLSAVFNWVTPIVSNGVIREKYFQPLVDEYNLNKIDVQQWLSSIMDEDIQIRLERDINSANLENIYSYIPIMKTSILKKISRKQPIRKFFNTMLRWYFRLNQFINDTSGGFISFHGTDEYEKTRIIGKFIEDYCDVFVIDRDAISLKNFRPNILPISNNDEINNKSYFSSFLTLGTCSFDYIIEYFYRIKKEILYHKTVIYNLYIYDVLTNPGILDLKLPYFIRNFFVTITPKPTVSFYLDGSTEVIQARNKGLNIDDINNQNSIYKDKISKNKRFTTLDISKSSDVNVTIAISEYIKKSCTKIEINKNDKLLQGKK